MQFPAAFCTAASVTPHSALTRVKDLLLLCMYLSRATRGPACHAASKENRMLKVETKISDCDLGFVLCRWLVMLVMLPLSLPHGQGRDKYMCAGL